MADSELGLMQVQVGKETVWGTPVAPTAKLMGIDECELTPMVESEAIPEIRGTLTPAYQSIVNRATGEASLQGTVLFEDIAYLLDSLLGQATPTGTGTFTRTYVGPGATKPTQRIMTLVKGGPEGVHSLEGALCNTLELACESNQRATFTAAFIGEQINDDTLVALSDRAVTIAHGNQLAVAIDDFGAAAGTTPYTAAKFSTQLSLDMAKTVQGELGSLTPGDFHWHKGDPSANQLMLSLEFDDAAGASKALLTALLGVTSAPFRKVVRLTWTLDAAHALRIDFAGFSEEAPVLYSDQDGVATVEFTLSALYEATLGNWLSILSTNQVSALP